MKKISIYVSSIFAISLLLAKQALAICPVCTVAVGVGVGCSRWLGVDDTITGLWIGGIVVSIIFWTLSWFDKKNIHFKGRGFITALGYYVLTFVPLYFTGLIGISANEICYGLDKLSVGVIVGSLAFWVVSEWYFHLKKENGGHANFPFQKVVMPVSTLIIISIIFYFLTR